MQVKFFKANTYMGAFSHTLKLIKQKESLGGSHFLVVPDRFSLISEKNLFAALDKVSILDTQVTTFNKLASKVIKEASLSFTPLTKQGGIMLISRIIFKAKNKLKAFKKAAKLPGFLETVYETINQIKSSNITCEEFSNSYTGGDTALKLKMEDLAFLYQEYQKVLEQSYLDSASKLDVFAKQLPFSEFIRGGDFYFTFFDSFTSQQLKVLEELSKVAKSVSIAFVVSEHQNKMGRGIYNVQNKLEAMCQNLSLDMKSLTLEAKEPLREEYQFLLDNFYSLNKGETELKDKSIQLFEAKGPKEELEFVATQINMAVVEKNLRYRDFSLALSSPQDYEPFLQEVFDKYNIPYFLDINTPLSEHVFVKFLFTALNVCKNYFTYKDVLVYTKNVFCSLSLEDQMFLEDFVLEHAINGSGFLRDFNKSTPDIQKYKDIKTKFIPPLINLHKALLEAKVTKEYSFAINNFLEEVRARETLELLEKNYGLKNNILQQKLTSQALDKTLKVISDFEELFFEAKLSLEEFYNILEQGLLSVQLSTIPIGVDNVFVGDASLNNFEKVHQLFVLGINENSLPSIKQDVGLLLDSDLGKLNTKNKLEPTIRELNTRSEFNFLQLLILPKQKLSLSYTLTNFAGEMQRPSLLFEELAKMFKIKLRDAYVRLPIYTFEDYLGAKYESEQNQARYYSFYYANPKVAKTKLIKTINHITQGVEYVNMQAASANYHLLQKIYGKEYLEQLDIINKQETELDNLLSAKELFFGGGNTKISQLERYFTCPFVHFIEYGLKAKQKERGGLRALDVGTILHSVAEAFGRVYKASDNIKEEDLPLLTQEWIENILSKPQYFSIIQDASNHKFIQSLKLEALRLVKALFKERNLSEFNLGDLEFRFGTKNSASALTIAVAGQTLEFSGVVDRVDLYKDYFRIIDYKTGRDSFSLSDLYFGKKIQLFIYSAILEKLSGKKPAGVFYLPIRNTFDKDTSAESTAYRLDGVMLDNVAVIKAMDKSLSSTNPKSTIIPVTVKSSKKAVEEDIFELDKYSLERTLTKEQFKALQDYAMALCKRALEEISQGYITPRPIQKDNKLSCEYCKYMGICKFSLLLESQQRKLDLKVSKKQLEEVDLN